MENMQSACALDFTHFKHFGAGLRFSLSNLCQLLAVLRVLTFSVSLTFEKADLELRFYSLLYTLQILGTQLCCLSSYSLSIHTLTEFSFPSVSVCLCTSVDHFV
jgi:hypothetical protein